MIWSAALALAVGAAVAAEADFDPGADQDRGAYSVEGFEDVFEEGAPGTVQTVSTVREYLRDHLCYDPVLLSLPARFCDLDAPPPDVLCDDGSTALPPLWVREQEADGTWGPWVIDGWYVCADDPGDLLAAIEREWTELRPLPTAVTLQPDTGRVYATVPTIAVAEDAPRYHSATILGAAVEIRATPASFTWNWGDGEVTTTADPGAPYPDATVTHAYGRALDEATVVLSTTWSGEYRIASGEWADFDSTITTTSPAITLEVLHPRTRLVDGPLD